MPRHLSIALRLGAKTTKIPGGCWLFRGSITGKGYGKIWFDGRKQLAHRVAWQLEYGAIPEGLQVCHSCDVRNCVKPEHLFLGTAMDNTQDAVAKNRLRCGRKLTPAQVEQIRNDPRTQRVIAAELGISYATVSLVKARKTWTTF